MLAKIPEARPGSLDNLYDASIALRYMAPVGHTIEDCRRPDYWRNVVKEAGQQRVIGRHAWNTIRVIAEDGTWAAEMLVTAAADGLVHTRLLHEWDWRLKAEAAAPAGYTVEHVAANGWRALEPGGTTLVEKRTTRDEALSVAQAHAAKARAVEPKATLTLKGKG